MAGMFQPGDVVVLKSGGPEMTVDHVSTDTQGKVFVTCTWFTGDERKSHAFSPHSLEAAEEIQRTGFESE